MLGVFSAIKDKVRVRTDKVVIDGAVCRLHYRVTTLVMVASCLLVTSQQYFGTHIQCILEHHDPKKQFLRMVSSYCFITSTFTIPKYHNMTVGKEIAHPGLGPHTPDDEIIRHAYYQWVPFVLFLQAMLFYTPHFIWKKIEGGKIKNVLLGLNTMMLEKDKREEKEKTLAKYMIDRMHSHNFWALCFYFCEILNLANVIGNIYLTDHFLGGEFTTYGPKVVTFLNRDPEERNDPMNYLFPKVTKCIFHKFGHSGTIEKLDAMCVLALNIINEKIYVFLWFWFIILAIISILAFLWDLLTISFGFLRKRELRLMAGVPVRKELNSIANKLQIGDWFLLKYLARNMDSLIFGEFLRVLAKSTKEDPLVDEK